MLCVCGQNDVMIWRSYPHYRSFVEGIPSQRASGAELWCVICCSHEPAVGQTVQWQVIWDALNLMLCNSTGVWACSVNAHFTPRHMQSRADIIRTISQTIVITLSIQLHYFRYHSRYGLSQWGTTLKCNVVSYWLSPYQEWSLYIPSHYNRIL